MMVTATNFVDVHKSQDLWELLVLLFISRDDWRKLLYSGHTSQIVRTDWISVKKKVLFQWQTPFLTSRCLLADLKKQMASLLFHTFTHLSFLY